MIRAWMLPELDKVQAIRNPKMVLNYLGLVIEQRSDFNLMNIFQLNYWIINFHYFFSIHQKSFCFNVFKFNLETEDFIAFITFYACVEAHVSGKKALNIQLNNKLNEFQTYHFFMLESGLCLVTGQYQPKKRNLIINN